MGCAWSLVAAQELPESSSSSGSSRLAGEFRGHLRVLHGSLQQKLQTEATDLVAVL